MYEVFKVALYTCSSYPKICAPHRLRPGDDFEVCVLSSVISIQCSLDVYTKVAAIIEGRATLGDLGVVDAMAKSLLENERELGHRVIPELVLAYPIVVAVYSYMKHGYRYPEAIRTTMRHLSIVSGEPVVQLVKAMRAFGGDLTWIVEQCDLTERRVKVENLSAYDVLQALSRHSVRFRFFTDMERCIELSTAIRRAIDETLDPPIAIAMVFNEFVKEVERLDISIPRERRSFVNEMLKIDLAMRREGRDYSHLLPYVALALVGTLDKI